MQCLSVGGRLRIRLGEGHLARSSYTEIAAISKDDSLVHHQWIGFLEVGGELVIASAFEKGNESKWREKR